MTVKVLVGPKKLKFKATCGYCEAQLAADREDLKAEEFGSMGDYEWSIYFDCPVCEGIVRVKVPPHIERKVIDTKRNQ